MMKLFMGYMDFSVVSVLNGICPITNKKSDIFLNVQIIEVFSSLTLIYCTAIYYFHQVFFTF